MSKLDGIICVGQQIAEYIEKNNRKKNLGIKHVVYIPPCFDDEKFVTFLSTLHEDRATFFKEHGVIIQNQKMIIISMIANFYEDDTHKNHILLFKAIRRLVYIKKIKRIRVMLAGDGPCMEEIKKLAHTLKVDKYIHFLGFVKNIPELLYYSDIHVLTSKHEAFGLAHLEAGIMKKPSLGAYGTGATSIIKHGETGFLFKNDDPLDLTNYIEMLINNPSLCVEMGNNAHILVQSHFSSQRHLEKMVNFFNIIMS